MVRERPPRRRDQVADHQRPVRGGARDRRPLRRWRPGDAPRALPAQHDRGDQPARLPAPPDQGRRRRHHCGGAPRQPAALARHARLRSVDVDERGTFDVAAVEAALDQYPRPRVLAISGGSNVTGWVPDLRGIAAAARQRGILTVVDGAQLVPHRPVDITALGIDVIAFSGHKMYAPYGAGALVAPRELFATGEPFLVGGGAVRARVLRRRHLGRRSRPGRRRLAERSRRRRSDRVGRRAAERRLASVHRARGAPGPRAGLRAGLGARAAATRPGDR